MNTSKRIPQAPSEPPPELEEFLSLFEVNFFQKRNSHTLERYITGLLTEHPNKNCDTLASVVPGTSQQRLNNLLTRMDWDEQDLNHQRINLLMNMKTEGDGVLIFDDTGFAKRGRHSAGVARQYSGSLGKIANCQVTVNCHYAERTIAWPVATRLYLPKEWGQDTERRTAAHIPEAIRFQTKAEIALSLLDEAKACGVKHACVVADCDYGDNPNFLNGLEQRRERVCAAVRSDFRVSLRRKGVVQRVDQAIAGVPLRDWQTVHWRAGSTGALSAKFCRLRCWRVDEDGSCHIGWLIGQRAARGPDKDRKYYWSNFGRQTSLEVIVE